MTPDTAMAAPRIVIVGAGMAGLSAAWECHRRGLAARVFEASDRIGGVVGTERDGDLLLDGGPDAFLHSKAGVRQLCDELGLNDELVEMLPPRGAYVLAGGAFHALPEGGALGVPVRVRGLLGSHLLSWRGKLRVAAEPFVPKRAWTDEDDEAAGSFFRRRFGPEVTARLAQPLLGGIHAGDLDSLSARAVIPQLVALERARRSVWMGLRRQGGRRHPGGVFRSFASGMGRLPDALAAALPAGTVRTQTPVTRVTRTPGAFRIETHDAGHVDADIVLLAVPAWSAADLLRHAAPEAATLCDAVPYVSSATALLAYPSATFPAPLRGSGYVIAERGSDDPVMAVTWVTGKWPGRAAAGTTLIRVFFGGEGHEADLSLPDAALVEAAHAHLARWWRAAAAPASARVFRWRRASPQHVVGHPRRVRALQAHLDALGTMGVAGSGFRAIGIPDVVSDARDEVQRLVTRWQTIARPRE